MSHNEILKMIEAVDPEDEENLAEIDARVKCYLDNIRFVGAIGFAGHDDPTPYYLCADGAFMKHWKGDNQFTRQKYKWLHNGKEYVYNEKHYIVWPHPQYCTSRDALKAIRPEGWHWKITANSDYECECVSTFQGPKLGGKPQAQFESVGNTEELTELHAIIQAIAYERQKSV